MAQNTWEKLNIQPHLDDREINADEARDILAVINKDPNDFSTNIEGTNFPREDIINGIEKFLWNPDALKNLSEEDKKNITELISILQNELHLTDMTNYPAINIFINPDITEQDPANQEQINNATIASTIDKQPNTPTNNLSLIEKTLWFKYMNEVLWAISWDMEERLKWVEKGNVIWALTIIKDYFSWLKDYDNIINTIIEKNPDLKNKDKKQMREDLENTISKMTSILNNFSSIIDQLSPHEQNLMNKSFVLFWEKYEAAKISGEVINFEEIMKESLEKVIWFEQLQTILNSPNTDEYIQKNWPILFEQNSLAYNALFDSNNLEEIWRNENQKKNLIDLLETYSSIWEKDENGNYKYDPYSIDFDDIKSYTQTTTEKDTRYKKGINVIRIPVKINLGPDIGKPKELEIFFWTTQQLHDARAEKTKSLPEAKEKSLQKLTLATDKMPLPINTIITNLDEAWSYSAFRDFLNIADKDYLANNMQSILEAIRTENEKKDDPDDKINGYYNVLANHVAKLARGGDLATLKIYLSFVKDNTSYLGTDSASKIATRNVIGRFGDTYNRDPNNPEHKELQSLLLTAKAQIDPNIKKDIITQIEDGVGAFMEQYWSAIATIVDFFWGKWAFMKMIPAAMREKFMEKFKETNQMTEEQKRNFEDIDKSFAWVNADKNRETEAFKGKPKEKAKEIINTLKNQTWDNSDKTKIKSWLENNFTKLSPWLVGNIIREYNKKHKDTPIQADTILVSDKKWLPVAIKETEDKTKIIEELLNSESTMRKSIDVAHSRIIENSSYNFSTEDKQMEDENINGTQEYKWIQSFRDVATYIAVYSATGWKPPYNYAISENNISTETNPRIEKPTTPPLTPEQQAEKTLNDSLKKASDEITTGNIIPAEFDVAKTTKMNDPNKVYFETIIDPIGTGLSSEEIIKGKSKFEITVSNPDIINALEKKPQVFKDIITYMKEAHTIHDDIIYNNTTMDTDKLDNIIKFFDNNTIDITVANDKKSMEVKSADNKKLTIKPGPIFEEVAQA